MKRILNVILFLMLTMSVAPAFSQGRREKRREPVQLCRRCERIVANMQMQRPVMNDDNFKKLSGYVKSVNFDDDRLALLRVAVMGHNFTSAQCAKLLSFFSFDSNRTTALKVLRPCMADTKNSKDIIKKFTFSSNKDEAMEILMGE